MSPLAPQVEKSSSGGRQRQEVIVGGQQLRGRSASFHGRGAEQQRHQMLPKQRPKTQPDLLAGVRGRSFRSSSGSADGGETTTPPERRDDDAAGAGGQEDPEQGAGERGRAAEPVAAARDGVGGVERGGPRGGRRGALRQGRQAAVAAVYRPLGLRPALLPVQLGESGPDGQGDGAGVPELLPVSPVLFGYRPRGLVFLLLRRSKHGQGRQGGSGCSRRTTGLAALHAVLADDVATPDHSSSLPTLVRFSILDNERPYVLAVASRRCNRIQRVSPRLCIGHANGEVQFSV